jgi:archaetidylinositol phosphate synthase
MSISAQPILPRFAPATRINRSLSSSLEARALRKMAEAAPAWVTSDQLTILGFGAQFAAGTCYAFAGTHQWMLWLVCLFLIVNWFGDSMDGTLARVRDQQRPRYGFYLDHMTDMLGAVALMAGLACSGFLHWAVAISMLVGFLLLSCESYLATYTLGRFELSQGLFGPTEIRLLLILGNLALLHCPYASLLHHRLLIFDIGGTIGAVVMFILTLALMTCHTIQLFRAEPLL